LLYAGFKKLGFYDFSAMSNKILVNVYLIWIHPYYTVTEKSEAGANKLLPMLQSHFVAKAIVN